MPPIETLSPKERLPKVQGWWLAFGADVPEEIVRRRFRDRYGIEPDEVVRAGTLLLAGPLPGREVEPATK